MNIKEVNGPSQNAINFNTQNTKIFNQNTSIYSIDGCASKRQSIFKTLT